MDDLLSPSARRALDRAWHHATEAKCRQVEPAHLLLALAEQEESRGATVLAQHGLTVDAIRDSANEHARPDPDPSKPTPATMHLSDPVRISLGAIRARGDDIVSTDRLLLALLTESVELRQQLEQRGLRVKEVIEQLRRVEAAQLEPITPEFQNLDVVEPTEIHDVYRVLDAAANRAREGLRTLEDYARFGCDDPFLTEELKKLRHQLQQALHVLPRSELIAARDTEHDVGAGISTASEWTRTSLPDVVAANFKRVQEAIRSLEEFGKLESRTLAEATERTRYRLYTLERAVVSQFESRSRLAGIVLYALVSPETCSLSLEWTVKEMLAGGTQMIQLRAKALPDRECMQMARAMRRWTQQASAIFIVNDRPDLARLAEADGVHVGQDELSVRDARRIVGTRTIVGVSTHSIEQARQAILEGADYIGAGPTFPSTTKSFEAFPGLELIRQVSREIRLPTFAIGGINIANIDSVRRAGATRVAVSSAICGANDPREAARNLRQHLDQLVDRGKFAKK